jgi:phosphoserine phosphatase
VAQRLGFAEFHANVLEFTAGKLSGVHGPAANGGAILDGAGKLRIMTDIMKQKSIAADAVCAIGDGSNDADMVREAGYGIAFNGKNKTLLDAANHRATALADVPALLAGKGSQRARLAF